MLNEPTKQQRHLIPKGKQRIVAPFPLLPRKEARPQWSRTTQLAGLPGHVACLQVLATSCQEELASSKRTTLKNRHRSLVKYELRKGMMISHAS